MNLLFVSATVFEIAPTLQWLEKQFGEAKEGIFVQDLSTAAQNPSSLNIRPVVTGVGAAQTALTLGALFAVAPKVDLAINAGIAGAFDGCFSVGEVVNVTAERYGDLGVEEADGRFSDLFEMGLMEAGKFPFSEGGLLRNPEATAFRILPEAEGLTVNRVHGATASIDAIRKKYPSAQIESMEGAAFFQACLTAGVPFLEIRSVSNRVESRNREKWDIPLAIDQLNQTLIEIVRTLLQ